MINTVTFKDKIYPEFQAHGNAAQFAIPFAKKMLKGHGLDIGCSKLEWAFPGAVPVDLSFEDGLYHANNLPEYASGFDYIFSSHCLEHVDDWVKTLEYWSTTLCSGGILFLYLPHYSQEYWRPWNNSKHVNVLTDVMLRDYLNGCGKYSKVFVTEGHDLNNSFYAIAERR